MIKCEYCTKEFYDTRDGLASKTFHEILHDPEIVNTRGYIKNKVYNQ